MNNSWKGWLMMVWDIEIGCDINLWAAFEYNLLYSIGTPVDGAYDLRFERSHLERAADQPPHGGAYFIDAGTNRSLRLHRVQLGETSGTSLVHPGGKVARPVIPIVALVSVARRKGLRGRRVSGRKIIMPRKGQP